MRGGLGYCVVFVQMCFSVWVFGFCCFFFSLGFVLMRERSFESLGENEWKWLNVPRLHWINEIPFMNSSPILCIHPFISSVSCKERVLSLTWAWLDLKMPLLGAFTRALVWMDAFPFIKGRWGGHPASSQGNSPSEPELVRYRLDGTRSHQPIRGACNQAWWHKFSPVATHIVGENWLPRIVLWPSHAH